MKQVEDGFDFGSEVKIQNQITSLQQLQTWNRRADDESQFHQHCIASAKRCMFLKFRDAPFMSQIIGIEECFEQASVSDFYQHVS